MNEKEKHTPRGTMEKYWKQNKKESKIIGYQEFANIFDPCNLIDFKERCRLEKIALNLTEEHLNKVWMRDFTNRMIKKEKEISQLNTLHRKVVEGIRAEHEKEIEKKVADKVKSIIFEQFHKGEDNERQRIREKLEEWLKVWEDREDIYPISGFKKHFAEYLKEKT